MNIKTKQGLAIGLSILAGIGVITTAILSAKGNEKANKKISEKEEVSKKEANIIKAKAYAPAAVSGAITIASITASTIISRKVEVSLIAAYGLLDQSYKRYGKKVIDKFGLDKHKDILKEMAKEDLEEAKKNPEPNDRRKYYWMEGVGVFRAEPEKIMAAYSNLNNRINSAALGENGTPIEHYYSETLEEFFDECDAVFMEKFDPEVLQFGWDYDYLMDTYHDTLILMDVSEPSKDYVDGEEVVELKFDKDTILKPGYFREA